MREKLAIAIFAACWQQYYDSNYRHSGPTPEKAWTNISEEQRVLFRHYADAAMEFFGR